MQQIASAKRASRRLAGLAGLGILCAAWLGPAAALELIRPEEAALPNLVGADLTLGFRGVTRGPKVLVVSPAPDAGMVRSPLKLRLKFEVHGGASIDPQLVKMIYLKNPSINLTQRVGDLIRPDGLEVDDARAPPGTHYIRVEVRDDAGRVGSTTFALMVAN
jgi:hypothetical protein